MSHTRISTLSLLVAVLLLAGYNFLGAQTWTPPTQAPPNGNVAAPINTSSLTQTKNGRFDLILGSAATTATTSVSLSTNGSVLGNIFAATSEMRSNRYCDSLGNNCTNASSSLPSIELGTARGETMAEPIFANRICHEQGYDGVWAFEDKVGDEDVICYKSDMIVGIGIGEVFVTAYHALRQDPAFVAFWGPDLPPTGSGRCTNSSLYRCGVGWLAFGLNQSNSFISVERRVTYDRICSFMMVNGSRKGGTPLPTFDSGSDNGNTAISWSGGVTRVIGHNNNNVDDILELTCKGDKVSVQGEWWRKSNRSEGYGRGGNGYPNPLLSGRDLPIR